MGLENKVYELEEKRDGAGKFGKIFQGIIDRYTSCHGFGVGWEEPNAPIIDLPPAMIPTTLRLRTPTIPTTRLLRLRTLTIPTTRLLRLRTPTIQMTNLLRLRTLTIPTTRWLRLRTLTIPMRSLLELETLTIPIRRLLTNLLQ